MCVLVQIGQNTIATIGSTAKIIPDTKTAPGINPSAVGRHPSAPPEDSWKGNLAMREQPK
jgi:hypothetical protein